MEAHQRVGAAELEGAQSNDRLLAPREVARLFGVSMTTVRKWGHQGRLSVFRTLGGHARFWESEVKRVLEETGSARRPLRRG